MYLPLPIGIIEWGILRLWETPRLMLVVATAIRPECLEKLSEKIIVRRFRLVLPITPALMDWCRYPEVGLPRSFHDFHQMVPVTTKDSYAHQYTLAERCVGGLLPSCGTLYESAGTSGKSTLWVHSLEDERWFERYVDFGLRHAYRYGEAPCIIINCWAFGTWPTAIDFTKSATRLARVVNIGVSAEKTLEMLTDLGKGEQYLIAGYPPFLAHLFEEGESRGFNWKEWRIDILSGGEGFIEEWRLHLKNHLGERAKVFSAFGSTDIGLGEGMENELTVAIRRILHVYQTFYDDPVEAERMAALYFPKVTDVTPLLPKDKESVRQIFLRIFKTDITVDRRLPMFFQYDPTMYFNEEIIREHEDARMVTELATSSILPGTALPRVRYNIQDERGRVKYRSMFRALQEAGIDFPLIEQALSLDPSRYLKLPFFYIYGRSDGTISVDGANIFPADVEEILADHEEFSVVGAFIMSLTKTHHLGFEFELKDGVMLQKTQETNLKKLFKKLLLQYSTGYGELVADKLASAKVEIDFFPSHTGPFEQSPLSSPRSVKHRYIRK
jgi:phenylacetate-CoA ligase